MQDAEDCLQPLCNTTWLNTGSLPSYPFLESLSGTDRALVIAAIVGALGSNALYCGLLALLFRRQCRLSYIRLASTLLALYPVYATVGCIAMMIPRATEFMSVLIAAYTMIVFNDFCSMLSLLLGGFHQLVERLDGEELARCKCCGCLPPSIWTKRKVRVMRALVRQGKVVQQVFVVISATLLMNGNYQRRPLELNQPLFYFNIIAGLSRFAATFSAVTLVRSSVQVLTGHSLGKKFAALQVINIVHLVQGFVVGFLQSRDLPLESYGLVSQLNRLELYRYFSLVLLTILCQLWSFYLFYKSASTQTPRLGYGDSAVTVLDESMSQHVGNDESEVPRVNRAV